jgi:hypothetical protein
LPVYGSEASPPNIFSYLKQFIADELKLDSSLAKTPSNIGWNS